MDTINIHEYPRIIIGKKNPNIPKKSENFRIFFATHSYSPQLLETLSRNIQEIIDQLAGLTFDLQYTVQKARSPYYSVINIMYN